MSYANNKGAGQPAHPCSLISAFIVHCLDSVMSLVSVTKISSLMLASAAEQASLSLTWLELPEDKFSHVAAHMFLFLCCSQCISKILCKKIYHVSGVNTRSHNAKVRFCSFFPSWFSLHHQTTTDAILRQ